MQDVVLWAIPYLIIMEELTNNQLIQRIETVFWPGKSWETCQFTLTTLDVHMKLREVYPGIFNDVQKLHELLNEMQVPYRLNEFNGKHYWLLDSAFNF